jgi:hypothetical protein
VDGTGAGAGAVKKARKVPAKPQNKQMQAKGVEHLRAQPPKMQVQGLRRVEHLRAQPHEP